MGDQPELPALCTILRTRSAGYDFWKAKPKFARTNARDDHVGDDGQIDLVERNVQIICQGIARRIVDEAAQWGEDGRKGNKQNYTSFLILGEDRNLSKSFQ
jgi:hypothetical protein